MGSLFGYKIKNSGLIYVVESFNPYLETEKRKADCVKVSEKTAFKSSWTIPAIEEHIGGYHSHPYVRKKLRSERRTAPSNTDLNDFFESNPDSISLILSLYPTRGYSRLSEDPLRISGTIKVSELRKDGVTDKKLHVSIAAHYWERSTGDRGRIRRAELEIVPKDAVEHIFNNNHAY